MERQVKQLSLAKMSQTLKRISPSKPRIGQVISIVSLMPKVMLKFTVAVRVVAAGIGKTLQFVNKTEVDDDTSIVVMMASTPEVNMDNASLTLGQNFCSAC